MTELKWGQPGERRFETGVDRGVLFRVNAQGIYNIGYAWNGLVSITESPSGAESNKQYADNQVYLNLISAEEYAATLEAFTYPDAWEECDGTAQPSAGVYVGQQGRATFGLAWRSKIGTDLNSDAGYKLHLLYSGLAAPSEKSHTTVNDSPEAMTFSWEISTTPVDAGATLKPTAKITIDSTKVPAANLKALEDIIYGTVGTDPRLPMPTEVFEIFEGTQTEVIPTAPTATAAGLITIPTVTGVRYRRADTDANVTGTVQVPGAIGASLIIYAVPTDGTYKFKPGVDDDWMFTKTA